MAHRIVMERPDMRKELEIPVKEKVIRLTSEIVYGQRIEWCSAVYHQMKMSMIAPRQHFPYDPLDEIYPVLVFFCGGGFTEMDRNVWVPELSWYAKHGGNTREMEQERTKLRERMDTLGKVRAAGLKICCGGIVGMDESRAERAAFIASLANLDPQPESVPINQLVKVPGTPLESAEDLDWSEFVRTVAAARITMPRAHVRLSAGRAQMPEAVQALCFLAGANSIFSGDTLLVTPNEAGQGSDARLLAKLGLRPEIAPAAVPENDAPPPVHTPDTLAP